MWRAAKLARHSLEAVELSEAVDHDAADARVQRGADLLVGLVVAVQHHAVGGDAGHESDVCLPARRHIEVEPLLVDQTSHLLAEECLSPVGDAVAESSERLVASVAEVLFVVDEQRRAVLLGEVEHVAPANRQPTLLGDRRAVGQHVPADGGVGPDVLPVPDLIAHIDSGALTPRRSSPMARPTREASTSHSLACVSSGGTSVPITQQSW